MESQAKSKLKLKDVVFAIIVATLIATTSIVAVMKETTDPWDGVGTPAKMMNRFSSYEELKTYVENSGQRGDMMAESFGGGLQMSPGLSTAGSTAGGASNPTPEYSGTNIQVEGVDEADIVKTDGTFVYVVSGNNVTIIRAYPVANAGVVSKITSGASPIEIFVNGDRLVVFGQPAIFRYCHMVDMAYPNDCGVRKTAIKVYDISSRDDPRLVQNISVTGDYFNSRMIGDYVYVVLNQYVTQNGDQISLPLLERDGVKRRVQATEIGYFNGLDSSAHYYTFATIVSVDLENTEHLTYDVFLTDGARHMYASINNLYLANIEYSYTNSRAFGGWMESSRERTWVHKISVDSGNIRYIQSTYVPGRVLNQFSMDEYDGYFRIATTVGQIWSDRDTSKNNVYVLDRELSLTGKLENLAPGEQIYSARFMGERCYLVTFKKIDPLFVIDLSNPRHPMVLGELKIPGYSDYLHPYDENHVIGIGKDAEDMGSFAWFQGVKMSLFDVSDVENPREVSQYIIGDRGTNSDALRDHKAFTFSRSNNLLIIPIHLAEVNQSKYPGEVPPSAYGEYVWQGAYVITLTLEGGFELKGKISHQEDPTELGYGWTSPYSIRRSLYVGDGIYTVSDKMVKINNMDDLQELKTIEF
jgi:uncharacterized secreted protein with C-terminal beta-propeller domain